MKNLFSLFALIVLSPVVWGQAPKPPDDSPSPIYTLTEEERAAGWKILFDGRNNAGLRGLTFNDFINRGWHIDHGTLFCEKGFKDMGLITGGHLITAEQFNDFEFTFEWKLSVSGKSGIMYFVTSKPPSATPLLNSKMLLDARSKTAKIGPDPYGFIYTIVDDTHNPDGLKGGPIKRSGSLYGVLPPSENKKLEEPGQWNRGKIVVQGNHVEHWLNGDKVLEFDIGTPELAKAIAASGIKGGSAFGQKFKTALVILDEGEEVEFRNLRVRPIYASGASGATPAAAGAQ